LKPSEVATPLQFAPPPSGSETIVFLTAATEVSTALAPAAAPLPVIVELVTEKVVPEALKPPARAVDPAGSALTELPLTVLRSIVTLTLAELAFSIAPPSAELNELLAVALAVLALSVLRDTFKVATLSIPAPTAFVVPPAPATAVAALPLTLERSSVKVPWLKIPPPCGAFCDVPPVGSPCWS
jgi:hypothetical protein